jgi:hypothetical protein
MYGAGDIASEERAYTTKHGTVATMKTGAIGKSRNMLAEARIKVADSY